MRVAIVGATLVALALMASILGCGGKQGFWRDQYVFVGDDGMVMPVAVLRWSDGHAEVKGWLGEDRHWQGVFHHRFAIVGRRAADAQRVLATFSNAPGAPARVSLRGDGHSIALQVRTPSRSVRLEANGLSKLGDTSDPEGPSTYSAGRATLRIDRQTRNGWLLVESTPADQPRRSFVDYGDYALVFATDANRVVVLKRSLTVRGFDHAYVRLRDATRDTTTVSVAIDDDAMRIHLPTANLETTLGIADRTSSDGVAPNGSSVQYDTLLLQGDLAGVAFLIHPKIDGPST